MRLKQLLGVVLLLVPATLAAAALSQLTSISVAGQGTATTVTLSASGSFTHTEYRPTDQLLLVDLPGVSPGRLKDSVQAVNRPGVESYRVVGYTGSNGTEVTRVEMKVASRAVVTVNETKQGLRVTVESGEQSAASTESAAPAAAATKPEPVQVASVAAAPATPKPEPVKMARLAPEPKAEAPKQAARVAAQPASEKPVVVRRVSVARGSSGMNVEIAGNGPMHPSALQITGPDRLVVDIPNAIAPKQRPIVVNGREIKSVRVAQYKTNPPVARIVLDLTSDHQYEIVPVANSVVVKVRGSAPAMAIKPVKLQEPVESAAPASPAPAKQATQAPKPVSISKSQPEANKASDVPQDFVFVEASYRPKPEAPAAAPTQPAAPAVQPKQMAESAAKVLEANREPKTQLIAMTPPAGAPAANLAAQQQQQQQQPPAPAAPQTMQAPPPAQPAAGARYTGEPISVNLKDVDLKDFFRLIHEISGLNIVLDPAVRGSLTLVLDDVPWDQALDIVLQNNGLDRRLEGNVLRIATRETFTKEAEARRAQAEAQALAVDPAQYTHYLSYAHAADLVPLIKRFLSARGDVLADPRTNALLIKDIPSIIPEVQRLLAQLDRKTQEVEIEARVVAATRNFARDIGTQLGFGWGNGPSAVGGAVAPSPLTNNVPAPLFFLAPGSTLASQQIPLFSNLAAQSPTSGISFSNATNTYRIDAVLTLAESRGLLKILSRPRVVTQNNIGATVKQGLRIPVVTQAQLGGPPTTTYIEAALRLQVTPQVTAENTIFLNVDVENTTPDFSRQVQGNPTLVTQQATTSVLVTDGGTVVIGGVIQTQNSINVQQVPLLGDIPVLGNLFKRRSVSTSTQELIFFITPKIIQT